MFYVLEQELKTWQFCMFVYLAGILLMVVVVVASPFIFICELLSKVKVWVRGLFNENKSPEPDSFLKVMAKVGDFFGH